MANARVWTGLGADNNWSTPQNWDMGGSSVPSGSDPVTFDGRGTKDCTVDNVAGWNGNLTLSELNGGYTGTVTVMCPLLLTSTVICRSGTLKYTTYDAQINNLQISGAAGTLTAPTGTLTITNNFSVTAGTYNHNGGIVCFAGSGNCTINVTNGQAATIFNLVQIRMSGAGGINSISGAGLVIPLGADPVISVGGAGNAVSLGSVTTNFSGVLSVITTSASAGIIAIGVITGAATGITVTSGAAAAVANLNLSSVSIPSGLNITLDTGSNGGTPALTVTTGSPKFGTINLKGSASGNRNFNGVGFSCALFKDDTTVAHTLRFGNNTTFSADVWQFSGSAGNVTSIQSISAGAVQTTLSCTGGANNTFSYVSPLGIKVDISPVWTADTTCTDRGGNENWKFNPPATTTPRAVSPILQIGPMVLRSIPRPALIWTDLKPTVDIFFAIPTPRGNVYANIGPPVLSRYVASIIPNLVDLAPVTDQNFIQPTYPKLPISNVGPVVLRSPHFPPFLGDLAPTVNTLFIFPDYPRPEILQIGPQVLRGPIWANIPDLLTKVPPSNTEFVFPTYPRPDLIQVGPVALRNPNWPWVLDLPNLAPVTDQNFIPPIYRAGQMIQVGPQTLRWPINPRIFSLDLFVPPPDLTFVFPTYPNAHATQLGPVVLRNPNWANIPDLQTIAPVTDQNFIFPDYPRPDILQIGPMVLRGPIWAYVPDMATRAPVVDFNFIFPTYHNVHATQLGPVTLRNPNWANIPDFQTVAPVTDQNFVQPTYPPLGTRSQTGPVVLRGPIWKYLPQPDVAAVTDTNFIAPTYPAGRFTQTGPQALRGPIWAYIPDMTTTAPVVDFNFVMPTYPDAHTMRVGPAVLRSPNWASIPDLQTVAPLVDFNFVMPTYPKVRALGPPVLFAARAGTTIYTQGVLKNPYYFTKLGRMN